MIKQTNTNCREKKDILRNKMNQRKKKTSKEEKKRDNRQSLL